MNFNGIRVGCSGWFYWHWRDSVYPTDLPTNKWFGHYQTALDTVELNAPFYRWPQPATVRRWAREAKENFRYCIKVNQLITHEKRFKGTKKLVAAFCEMADVLGERLGCFLFQLPPSFRYTAAPLRAIVNQLDPRWRNAVEFRHRSWWNDEVFAAFKNAERRPYLLFCKRAARAR